MAKAAGAELDEDENIEPSFMVRRLGVTSAVCQMQQFAESMGRKWEQVGFPRHSFLKLRDCTEVREISF